MSRKKTNLHNEEHFFHNLHLFKILQYYQNLNFEFFHKPHTQIQYHFLREHLVEHLDRYKINK